MKPLPKTLRQVRRYLLIQTDIPMPELAQKLKEGMLHLVGIRGVGDAEFSIKKVVGKRAIIQTNSQGLPLLKATAAYLCTCGNHTQTIKASGMISNLEELCKA